MPPQEVTTDLGADVRTEDADENVATEEKDTCFMERFHRMYRPLLDHPGRRVSIYQWIKGKREDDNVG